MIRLLSWRTNVDGNWVNMQCEPTKTFPQCWFSNSSIIYPPPPLRSPLYLQPTCSSAPPSGCGAVATCTLRAWRCTTSTGGRASPACPRRAAAPWACRRATARSSASPSGSSQQSSSRATGTCWGTTSRRRSSTPSSSKSVGVGWEWEWSWGGVELELDYLYLFYLLFFLIKNKK